MLQQSWKVITVCGRDTVKLRILNSGAVNYKRRTRGFDENWRENCPEGRVQEGKRKVSFWVRLEREGEDESALRRRSRD